MKMDADESWIDAEIERELAGISDDATETIDDPTDDTEVATDQITESDDIDILLQSYQNRSNNVVQAIKTQLDDVDSFLSQKLRKSVEKSNFDDEIRNAAKSRGVDVSKFQAEILSELEAEDAKDIEIAQSSRDGERTADTENGTPNENEASKEPQLTAEEGALVEFCESDELERKLRDQMNDWIRKQKEKENTRTVENEQNFHKIKERLHAMENQRQNLLDSMKREEISLEEVKTLRQAEIDIESQEAQEHLKSEESKHQQHLKEIEDEHKSQRKYMDELKSQAQSIENHRKHSSATKIQSLWRGYRTRLEYGETVAEWVAHGRRKREERRLREIETEIIERETIERKRIEEEQRELRRLEMERLKEEEKKRKEEKERLIKLEEEKIEAEKKRKRDEERERFLEEERKRLIEEEKKAKEQIRLEEERKKRNEKVKEEEEKRLKEEAETRRQEELERVEEEKRKLEEQETLEERKRKEEQERIEAERVRELEEKLKQEEAERKRKEDEKRRIEAERKAEIERQKKREEEKRIEEEKRKEELRKAEEKKKAESEQKRLAESMEFETMAKEKFNEKFGSSEAKVEPIYRDSPQSSPEKKTVEKPEEPTHSELVQKGRLSWMQSCIPLSKLLMEAKSRKALPSTIPKRRPSSSKKLSPIPDDLIFTDGISDSYDEVFTLKLEKLPAYNLQTLSQCTNLTTVEIIGCQIVLLDVFEKCEKLRSLVCRNSKVEVVNLKNLKELVYLDLSENQISSIHGLDGCSSLCYLDLHKNRITRIENLCHLINLHTLNLSQNSISRTTNISEAPKIQKLNLSKNTIRKFAELEKLSLLSHLDLSDNSLDSMPILTNHVLLENLNLQNNGLTDVDALGVFWLPLLTEVSLANNSISAIPKLDSTISIEKLNLADNSLGELADFLPSLMNCERLENLTVSGNPVSELTPNMRDLVKTALPWLKMIDGFKIESKIHHKTVSEFFNLCASQLKSRKDLEYSYGEKLKEIEKEIELVPQIHGQFYEKSHKMAADFRYAHEYGDLKMDLPDSDFLKFEVESLSLRSETPAPTRKESKPDLKDISKTNIVDARSKFEMALGSKPKPGASSQTGDARSAFDNALKSSSESRLKSPSKISAAKLSKHDQAAVKIQSVFRGYVCRKKIALACDFTKDMDLDSFDEIDLDAWDLDESALDQEWIPSATPNLVTSSPVLGPIQPGPPKEAWQNLSLKPPRSPVAASDMDTTRTKGSKSEQLTEEWGFKDSKTAEMMMKRAKKLKYDALKRKRLAQLDPQQRLVLTRKLEESHHLPAVQPPRRPHAQRKDYFRAKEEEAQRERFEKATESKNKMHRMYEWLHTAANTDNLQETQRTISHKPPIGLKRTDWAGSEGSLPRLEDTRTHRTVDTDLSIHSVESDRSGRRYSYDGTGGRKVPFPPIKNNSAPSDKRGPSPQMGWGGGKKRGTSKRLS